MNDEMIFRIYNIIRIIIGQLHHNPYSISGEESECSAKINFPTDDVHEGCAEKFEID